MTRLWSRARWPENTSRMSSEPRGQEMPFVMRFWFLGLQLLVENPSGLEGFVAEAKRAGYRVRNLNMFSPLAV